MLISRTIAYQHNTDYRKYIGVFEIIGTTWRVYHEAGHSDLNTSTGAVTHLYYVRDYLGSTRAVIDESGNVLQSTAYYPSGVPLTPNTLTPQTIKLHTGKDYFDLQGAGWYDNHARYYDCLLPTFKSQDPLAETTPWISPYAHCSNNPLLYTDPTGLADFVHDGKIIGNDGVDDDRVLVIKTTKKKVESGGISTNAAHLSKKIQKEMTVFINENSGNTESFSNLMLSDNTSIYDNVVEIEPSNVNRSKMMEIVSADDGTGRGDNCNREHGGYIKNGTVIQEPSGPIYKGGEDPISIPITEGYSSFHSHPSTRFENSYSNRFSQVPSTYDLTNGGNNTHYVFSAYDKKVYIYNQNGIQAIIPLNRFINLK